jgi:L-threonylcarbamoyladenylate synthase
MRNLASIIKNNGVAVIKTDTLYGIVGLAKNSIVVDRIYKLKNRNPLKPVVVLISSFSDIENFGIHLSDDIKEKLNKYWPGKISIIIPVDGSLDLHYLHKGTGGIAFRLPDDENLIKLIKQTGPLVAPSANPEGLEPAKNIKEAMQYFGDFIDYYDDRGDCKNTKASKIISFVNNNMMKVIRN